MTQEEIAKKLQVTQASVSRQIATIEKQLPKWISIHLGRGTS
jgi:DNA-binding transcriptional regulator LsrR (DeoR family)